MKKLVTLLLTCFAATTLAQQPVRINFAAEVSGETAACGVTYEGIGTMNSSIELQDLRFYVSNLRLITATGKEVPVSLEQDSIWQHEGVSLLDFEDATARCAESGNTATNSVVTGYVPNGTYSGLIFTVGVPFDLNHADVTTAPSPLNISSMWWNWQGGYKHLRIDVFSHASMTKTSNGANSEPTETSEHSTSSQGLWPIHLGSTGCVSDASTLAPVSKCTTPNTFEVRLDSFDPTTNTVVADIATLLDGVDVSQSLEMAPPGCMSGPQDPDCNILFANLSLSSDSTQTFFHVR